jgi:hypothetical protein
MLPLHRSNRGAKLLLPGSKYNRGAKLFLPDFEYNSDVNLLLPIFSTVRVRSCSQKIARTAQFPAAHTRFQVHITEGHAALVKIQAHCDPKLPLTDSRHSSGAVLPMPNSTIGILVAPSCPLQIQEHRTGTQADAARFQVQEGAIFLHPPTPGTTG